jgi:hypothetical protein
MSSLPALRKPSRRKNLWFERLMAIAATANLALVAFDLSYISWRDFWLRRVTILSITQWYDPIKGIEPHRDTQQYLESVDLLTQELSSSATATRTARS